MTRNDAALSEEEFAEWASACDEALRSGRLPTLLPQATTNSALLRRQQRFQACLRRLAKVGQQSPGGNETPTLDSTASAGVTGPFPTKLGRFQLLRVLGAGGFGVVYLATDPRLGRQVALKVPRPEALLSAELRQRFVREAQTAARLNHPHIVPVFESAEAGPFCYLVSAYCARGSLAGWMARQRRPLPVRIAATLTAALARAIHYAHERGVLHRDLKPANILLEPLHGDAAGPWCEFGFVPRIADFGLAKFLEGQSATPEQATDASETPASALSLTGAQTFLGTPSYMAPEQAESRHHELGPATDIYALGAILYELVTGRPPFRGETTLETLRQVVEQEQPTPNRLRPDVPPDLEAICLKCLEKRPSGRYANANELADDLERFLTGQPTQARPVRLGARALKWCRRKPAVAALLGSLCLAFAVLATSVVLHLWQQQVHDAALADLAQQERQKSAEAARLAQHAQHRVLQYANQFPFIAAQWQEGQKASVRPLLNELLPAPGQPDVRGFEWRFLSDQTRPTQCESKHRGETTAVAFSADGRQVFSTFQGAQPHAT